MADVPQAGQSKYRRDNVDLLQRLRRIEGQVRGIQRMIEDDRYCVDILMQLSAIKAALGKVELSLLEDHAHGCVARAIEEHRGEEAIDELMTVVRKMM